MEQNWHAVFLQLNGKGLVYPLGSYELMCGKHKLENLPMICGLHLEHQISIRQMVDPLQIEKEESRLVGRFSLHTKVFLVNFPHLLIDL